MTAAPRQTAIRHADVQALIRCIPAGRVATYGQLAAMLGSPRAARQVGYALAALPDKTDVPWHRVVNARGQISRRGSGWHDWQRILLEEEGVCFDRDGRIDLSRFGWCRSAGHG